MITRAPAWLPVAVVAAVGLAITAVAYLTVKRVEERRVVDELNFQVDWRAKDLQAKIRLAGQPLVATVTDVETAPHLTAQVFRQFTRSVVAQMRSVASLSWAPPVAGPDRAAFEASAGFPVIENGANGKRGVAAERDSYTLTLAAEPVRQPAAVRLCSQFGIPAHPLRLELTETAAMANHALMLEVLTRVRLKGFRLAIDDFGTGYSSLVQLHRLPFTELKIDQSFVQGMLRSEEADIIVGAIINLGRSLRLELVAEGVETEELLQRLIALGCETGQGYLFSRPMPAAEVREWLAHNSPHVAQSR